MDRWTEFELFVQTAELGSLSKAAEQLDMSNATASRCLGIVTVTIEAGKVDRCRHPSPFTTAIVFQTPSSVARCAGISDFS